MRAQGRPRSSQVPSPIAGFLAPLASMTCMAETRQKLEKRSRRHYVPLKFSCKQRHRQLCSSFRQGRKHRVWRMCDHSKKGARGSARHALALLPVPDGLDGHADLGGKFLLGQPRAAAQVAHAWLLKLSWLFNLRRLARFFIELRRERKLLPVAQFDNPTVRLQPKPLHDLKPRAARRTKSDCNRRTRLEFPDRARQSIIGQAD